MSLRSHVSKLLGALTGPAAPPPLCLTDPTFGPIEYHDGHWFGEGLRLAPLSARPLTVTVPGTATGPSDEGRRRFAEVVARLPELKAQVAAQLFEDYLRLRDEPEVRRKALPPVDAADEIWKLAHVGAIWLVLRPGERRADFEVDYEIAWDDDHTFNALFEDWRVVELRKDG